MGIKAKIVSQLFDKDLSKHGIKANETNSQVIKFIFQHNFLLSFSRI